MQGCGGGGVVVYCSRQKKAVICVVILNSIQPNCAIFDINMHKMKQFAIRIIKMIPFNCVQ